MDVSLKVAVLVGLDRLRPIVAPRLRRALDQVLTYEGEMADALNKAVGTLDRYPIPEDLRRVLLNFFDSFLRLDSSEYKALSFPPGFFENIIEHLVGEEPGLMVAIEAWDAEWSLTEGPPSAYGLLGTACREVTRLAGVLEGRR
jgi:hypothetical protein